MRTIFVILLGVFLLGCANDITSPSKDVVVFPVTYVEWEYRNPLDTTWWTLTADGKCYAAWKRKITMITNYPSWEPQCYGTDKNGNCWGYRQDPNTGEYLDANGRTEAQYNAMYAAQIKG